ncbi:MAG: FtsX-like permease family protein [Xanthomonadales bacterium]|nr:ABC transporter permease [Gammaproteobacteria bacterium]MBT8055582.1 ABC transporter permease [Gammaproteobacteria bacterium]NNL03827.1 FtsX-like permease family protein [Xanthomonadales bacterium]
MTDIGPIFRALLQNKLGTLLIALQIALTLAIVTNAAFITQQRAADIARPTGLDEPNTGIILTTIFDMQLDQMQMLRDDLETLRTIPGVIAATVVNSVPASGSGWNDGLYVDAEQLSNESVNYGRFMVDEQGLDTFGLELVAGRNFEPEDMVRFSMEENGIPGVLVVSQALADALFPDGDALGKTVFNEVGGGQPMRIVGIYDHMQNAWPSSDRVDLTALVPVYMLFGGGMYTLRTEPGQLPRVLTEAEELLSKNRSRIIDYVRTFEEQKRRTYSGDIAMIKLLGSVIAVLSVITGLGIVGLAWFSVTQRRKQIGTRRALGATRWDIVRYFMVEIGLISMTGLFIGMIGTIALNWFLDTSYEVGRMPLWYLPVGTAALWLLGQLAVLVPARRAAKIPPALATRSV